MEDEYYLDEFSPGIRRVDKYCDLSKELVKAAEYLENDHYFDSDEKLIPDPKLSTTLADWLMYKAGILDEHFRVWENEERKYPNSVVSLKGGAKAMAELQFSHALAVAREIVNKVERDRKSDAENKEG